MSQLIPIIPPAPITTRVAGKGDLPWIDALQKKHSRQLGFFPRQQMEEYIERGWVVVAEGAVAGGLLPTRLGYCASRDRYLKRDELGAIFQLCVEQGSQRKLVGATLVRSVFERASYGCKLYCCWCAKDLAANRFWESLGFVPLAFRAGSEKKGRVHIFWQRRIREGDTTTPWWFPSATNGGSIREDRIVLPIPPGVRWSEIEAIKFPVANEPLPVKAKTRGSSSLLATSLPPATLAAPVTTDSVVQTGGLHFGGAAVAKAAKVKRARREKAKASPEMIAAARELRDRWLEEVNAGRYLPGTTDSDSAAKYDVARMLPAPLRQLAA